MRERRREERPPVPKTEDVNDERVVRLVEEFRKRRALTLEDAHRLFESFDQALTATEA